MNLASIILALIIFGLFALIIGKGIANRKNGKSSCSCGCAGCPGSSKGCGNRKK